MKNYVHILFSSSVLAIFDQAIFSGSNFLMTLFLAQKLELTGFGILSSIIVFTFLFISVSNALIIQPFQVSTLKIEQKKQYTTFLWSFQMFFLVLIIPVVTIITFVFKELEVSKASLGSILIFIIGYLFQDFFRKLFLGTDEIKKVVLIDIIFTILVIIGFTVYDDSLNLKNTLYIVGLANILSSIPGIIYTFKNFEFPFSYFDYLKLHLIQGKWFVYTAFLQWCSSNFFILLSGAYLGIEALGALRLVQSIFGVINIVLQTIENYFIPKVASLYKQSIDVAKRYLIRLTSIGFVVFGGILSCLFIFSKELMFLIGGKNYASYHFIIKMMAILYVFIFLSYPIRIAVRVLILNKIFFTGYVLSFITSIITFHFLLQNFALNGAITGLILNQIVMMGYWYFELNKKHLVLWK